MGHFRGTLQGQRGEASRLGTKKSGLSVEAASWEGRVRVRLYHMDGHDYVYIYLDKPLGQGIDKLLYNGRVDGTV